jgi:glycosyltransferase involved in cell wall biosynthesis
MCDGSPLVCICIPTYNAEKTIRETLTSVVNQGYRNLNILIVDNASTDNTLAVVETFSDPRISIHRNEVNVGGEGNFNRCIQLAQGKYTAIYHADDVYEPQMVARQVAFLEAYAEAGAVFTEASLIDDNGKIIGDLGLPKSLVSMDHLYDFKTIFKSVLQYSNFLICPSVMARTDVYQQDIKKWRGNEFRTSADLDVWLRIARRYAIGIIPERLMRYRISLAQYSAQLRSRIDRSDFFLVMDDYLAQAEVQALLSSKDWLNFRRLERTDRIVRAVNLYLLGREQEALALSARSVDADAFRAAIANRRGLMTLIAVIFLRIFIFLHLPVIGKYFFRSMKRFARK